jgi:PAS domain S-box-containing protein
MMPLKGEDGQPQGFLKILRDRTQRKLADEARARLAALVQSSADAIISKNLQGTILNWNAAAERLLGYRADEIIGQSIFRLCPPGRDQEERDILARIQAGESLDHFETIRQARDGRIIPVSLTVSPIRDEAGNIMGVSSIARDITRQKLAEQMLRKAARSCAAPSSSTRLS